ncbi:phosphatidylserine decarboxylase proenzyme [Bacillus sp. OxB-1]|uniref:archaetidylserine decarboxylase n=1 Tax=Bacillus sp. (strain OxB-1) TaxID=98228 RepID=UPI000581EF7E|nr:archaetidylserine decarboxylase [Bacillus sp. OxB-1]BAQ10715.1 phosphatidylserine decarboxylase proenzyme [Bacillus sp. OxB-1]
MVQRKLFKAFVELTGRPLSSSILKTFTRSSISRPLIQPFSRYFEVNEKEMERPLNTYDSLNSFFTRNLKEGSRVIDPSPDTLVSPVDGIVNGMGTVNEDQEFYIKGQPYQLADIFGSRQKAGRYAGGFFYILYLSPSHYHHFHYPVDGDIISRYALGNVSYPVNELGLQLGDRPFATNYRLISEMETNYGNLAIVKVGALNVNSVQIRNASKVAVKGEEFGHFSFGSTVILFLEPRSDFQPLIEDRADVKVGQPIGRWMPKA